MDESIPDYFPDANSKYLNRSLHDSLLRMAEATEDPELRQAAIEAAEGKRDFREVMWHRFSRRVLILLFGGARAGLYGTG
jgi:hypothetical protein